MCLLVYKQPTAVFPIPHAHAAASSNSDGFGMAWHDGRQWFVHRTLEVLEHVRLLPLTTPHAAVIHYRMATHGAVSLDNVHPFLVGEPDDPHAFVVAHNGMFYDLPRDPQRSDTRLMVDHVFSYLKPGWQDDDVLLQQLGELFGYNKVAVLFPDGTRVLFGESRGHWDAEQEVWYSNDSYRPRRYTPTTTPTPSKLLLPGVAAPTGLMLADANRVIGFVSTHRGQVLTARCHHCATGLEQQGLWDLQPVTAGAVYSSWDLGSAQCGRCLRSLRKVRQDVLTAQARG
jgi:glutamine amidotransferase